MKLHSPIILIVFALSACSDSDPDFFRSSKNIATQKINMYIYADVHTHLGAGTEADETHTTVRAELYGYDKKGYLYNIELADQDQLNVDVNGASVPLLAEAYPSEDNTAVIIYTQDFDNTTAGAEFVVSFSRDSEAAMQSVPVMLLENASLNVTPTATEMSLNETLSLEWTELETYSYRLKFQFLCERNDGTYTSSSVIFPNHNVTTLVSPFTFNPSNFFTPPTAADAVGCELHSSLYSKEVQETPTDLDLESLYVRATRQHHSEKTIILM